MAERMEERESARAVLSRRLRMLADMVTPGNRLADVGCDHGFLDICLVGEGVCPRALAMDVREGPLESAREHVRRSGLGDYIEIRMSDGLEACGPDEADTLVCAGMGGRLMERILTEGLDKAARMKELILQPQSELRAFRRFLRNAGFGIVREDAVFEEGKYYFAMRAVPRGGEPRGTVCGGEEMSAGGPAGVHNPADIGGSAGVHDLTGIGGSAGIHDPADIGRLVGSGAAPGSRGASESASGCVLPAEQTLQLYDRFGELLLKGRHPVLRSYLLERKGCLQRLGSSVAQAGTGRAKGRLEELREELDRIEQALQYFGKEGSG